LLISWLCSLLVNWFLVDWLDGYWFFKKKRGKKGLQRRKKDVIIFLS